MLVSVEQGQLVDEDRAERPAGGVGEPLRRYACVSVMINPDRPSLELLVEVLDGPAPQLVEYSPDLHPVVSVRVLAVPRCDQYPPIPLAL